MRKFWSLILAVVFIAIGMVGSLYGQSDLCQQVDSKPVLSLQQVNQAELVHLLLSRSGQQPPSPEGKTPEQYCAEEVAMLVDMGYPAILGEVEPDRLVNRRYFATTMYQVAVLADEEFASRHGGLTDETEQMNALMEEEWIFAQEGNLYREEAISILCRHDITFQRRGAVAVDVQPEQINEATIGDNIEKPYSQM